VRDGNKSSYRTDLAWVDGDGPVDLHREEQLRFNRFIMNGGM